MTPRLTAPQKMIAIEDPMGQIELRHSDTGTRVLLQTEPDAQLELATRDEEELLASVFASRHLAESAVQFAAHQEVSNPLSPFRGHLRRSKRPHRTIGHDDLEG